jgi:hypothetical protein
VEGCGAEDCAEVECADEDELFLAALLLPAAVPGFLAADVDCLLPVSEAGAEDCVGEDCPDEDCPDEDCADGEAVCELDCSVEA